MITNNLLTVYIKKIMKKFLFAIMAIAAGLVFGSCASEEEQTEEVAEEPVVEEIDTTAVDTAVVEEPVVEEPAPAPKKAKKAAAKQEEPEQVVIIPGKDSKASKVGAKFTPKSDENAPVAAKKATTTEQPAATDTKRVPKMGSQESGVKVATKK